MVKVHGVVGVGCAHGIVQVPCALPIVELKRAVQMRVGGDGIPAEDAGELRAEEGMVEGL